MTTDKPMREPDQIRQDCARKLRVVQVSDHFQAILGCLLGEDWTSRRLLEMVVTSDGHLLGRCDGEAEFKAFLGEVDVPGNKFFATGSVINPRRQSTPQDRVDSISDYLKRGKSYTKGFVYFPPSVTYENFTDDYSFYTSRVDVESWENFVPSGVTLDWPALPRHKTVYAAIVIEQDHFDAIRAALSGEPEADLIAEEVKEAEKLFEGASKTITVNAYERSRKARTKCIEHHGWNCAVCDYNMAELYGELGEGVIHVHHLPELRSLGEEYEIDPIEDLRPVCPNCHAILHTTSPALSIKKLRKILANQSAVQWPKL